MHLFTHRKNRVAALRFLFLGFLLFCQITQTGFGQNRTKGLQNPNKSKGKPPAVPVIPIEEPKPTIMVAAPTDDLMVNYTRIYQIRIFPNFVSYIEIPDTPEAIIVGNPARFQVDRLNALGERPADGPVLAGNSLSRTLLIKPLKVLRTPEEGPSESNLTIRLVTGRVISILLRNAESEEQTVYRCRFRDEDSEKREQEFRERAHMAAQLEAERGRQTAESLERASNKLRQWLTTTGVPKPVSEVTLKEAAATLFLEREGEYLLALVRIEPRTKSKSITLTTPTWKLDDVELMPKAEIQSLPGLVKRQAVQGGYIFQIPAWQKNPMQGQSAKAEQLNLSLGLQGTVVQLNGSLARFNPTPGLQNPELKALPGYDESQVSSSAIPHDTTQPSSNNSKSEPQGNVQQKRDNLTQAQTQGLAILNQVTGIQPATGTIRRKEETGQTISSNPNSLPQPPSGAQEKLNLLLMVSNVRSPQTLQTQTRQIILGLHTERVGEALLAVVCLERQLGSDGIEIGYPKWEFDKILVAPILAVKPLPQFLAAQPLVTGFLFQPAPTNTSTLTLTLKVGRDALRIMVPPAVPPTTPENPSTGGASPGTSSKAVKRFSSETLEWTLQEVRFVENESRFRFEARNVGNKKVEGIEAFILEPARSAEGADSLRSLPAARITRDKERLNPGEKARFMFVFSGPPPQTPIEIRWKCDGVIHSLKIELFK